MKILYAAGNRLGSNFQLKRIFENLAPFHEIKIAAYNNYSHWFKNIDWTLDALLYNFNVTSVSKGYIENIGIDNFPAANVGSMTCLYNDIEEFSPDLIISDNDKYVAYIAENLKVPLWYCSPVLLAEGIKWNPYNLRYITTTYAERASLKKIPKADRYLIYSPFGDVYNAPQLKEGYEWVTPYYCSDCNGSDSGAGVLVEDVNRLSNLNIIIRYAYSKFDTFNCFDEIENYQSKNDYVLNEYKNFINGCKLLICSSETSYISDLIYNGKDIVCSPNINDIEGLINSTLIENLDLGIDVGQVELMEKYSIDKINEISNLTFNNSAIDHKGKFLHEIING